MKYCGSTFLSNIPGHYMYIGRLPLISKSGIPGHHQIVFTGPVFVPVIQGAHESVVHACPRAGLGGQPQPNKVTSANILD